MTANNHHASKITIGLQIEKDGPLQQEMALLRVQESEAAAQTESRATDFLLKNSLALLAFSFVVLSWEYPTNELAGVTFNVYQKDALSAPFSLLTNVSGLSVTLDATNAAAFYGVKALKNGIESDWARSGP